MPTQSNVYKSEQVVGMLVETLIERFEECQNERGAPRVPYNIPITLHEKTTGGAYKQRCEALGINISLTGIGFVSSIVFRPQEIIYVNLEPVIGRRFLLPTRVVHSFKAFDHIHRTGGVFVFDDTL